MLGWWVYILSIVGIHTSTYDCMTVRMISVRTRIQVIEETIIVLQPTCKEGIPELDTFNFNLNSPVSGSKLTEHTPGQQTSPSQPPSVSWPYHRSSLMRSRTSGLFTILAPALAWLVISTQRTLCSLRPQSPRFSENQCRQTISSCFFRRPRDWICWFASQERSSIRQLGVNRPKEPSETFRSCHCIVVGCARVMMRFQQCLRT